MNKQALTVTSVVLLTVLAAGVGSAHLIARAQDRDEAAERRQLGAIAFDNACLMCHGRAIVAGQRFTATQWEASIDKMIGFGARVSSDERAPLVEYLSHDIASPPAELSVSKIPKPPAGPPLNLVFDADTVGRGAAVYHERCLDCHGADARGGEPGDNLVENPILLDAAAFRAVVNEGRHRMPAFGGSLTEAQTGEILAWLRTLVYDPVTR